MLAALEKLLKSISPLLWSDEKVDGNFLFEVFFYPILKNG